MVKVTNGGQLVVWKLAFRLLVVALKASGAFTYLEIVRIFVLKEHFSSTPHESLKYMKCMQQRVRSDYLIRS